MKFKLRGSDLAFIILGVVIWVSTSFLPKSGKFALSGVVVTSILFLGASLYIFIKLRKAKVEVRKNLYVYGFCIILAFFGLLNTKDLIMDAVSSPSEVELRILSLTKSKTLGGIPITSYSLHGEDKAGKEYVIDISKADYKRLDVYDTFDITYYKNTKILYKVIGIVDEVD